MKKKSLLLFTKSELIDDFFDINDQGIKVIKQYYIHNPVRSFKPVWKTFYGPDQFRDMTFGEYRDGPRLFHDFHTKTCIF
jgi:hypothetical protein